MKRSRVESLVRQVMWVGTLMIASLAAGLPLAAPDHYQDALRDIHGLPLSCEHQGAIDQVAAIIFLSAGISTETAQVQLPQIEKRRLEGLTSTYAALERLGIPPQAIILAMGPEDDQVNPNMARNYVQREYGKLKPGENIPDELFHIIHVKNTKISMDESKRLMESMGLEGPTVIVTSDIHMSRSLFDACASGLGDVIPVTAEQMIRLFDQEQYEAMVANSQTLVHQKNALLEEIKQTIGYFVPNKLGLHHHPYAP